jgi:hypothetical protein
MKANSPNTNSQFIVFGLDDTGKPKAGRFTHKEAEAAKAAATSMKLNIREFTSAEAEDLMKQIPVGRIHAKGKAFIPFIKQELYDMLSAEASKTPATQEATSSTLEQSLARAKTAQASALPTSWDTIAPGHMVLFCELPGDGFYEAVVIKRDNEILTMRFRDFPKHQTIRTHIHSVALVHPGL